MNKNFYICKDCIDKFYADLGRTMCDHCFNEMVEDIEMSEFEYFQERES